MPDDSNRVAVMYGPLVLAGDLGPVNDSASNDAMYVPVMMTDKRDPRHGLSRLKENQILLLPLTQADPAILN